MLKCKIIGLNYWYEILFTLIIYLIYLILTQKQIYVIASPLPGLAGYFYLFTCSYYPVTFQIKHVFC